MTLCSLALAIAGLTVLAPAPDKAAHDWPGWRGPNRDDVSTETGLLKNWPDGGPKLLWTYKDAGIGYSGFAVVGKRLYSMGADDKKEYLFALDVDKGEKVWSTEVGDLLSNGWGDGPRGTPTVDGDRVYAISGTGNLVCLDTQAGEKKWSKSLAKDLGGGVPGWGYTESPLVDGDLVICTPGGKDGTLAALDKKTGDVIWRSKEVKDGAQYSSVVVSKGAGIRHYVQLTGDHVFGVDPKNGNVLWNYPRKGQTATIPTPVAKDDCVFVTSGYGVGCNMVSLSPDGDKIQYQEEYANKDMENHHGGVLLVGDYLYGYSDSKGWICQELKTGKVVWPAKDRVNKLGKGSVTCADGHLYCYDEGKGTVVLVEATPTEEFKEVGRFTIPEHTKKPRKSGLIWTHPVVANGRLYLRDQDLIFCYDVKNAK